MRPRKDSVYRSEIVPYRDSTTNKEDAKDCITFLTFQLLSIIGLNYLAAAGEDCAGIKATAIAVFGFIMMILFLYSTYHAIMCIVAKKRVESNSQKLRQENQNSQQ